MDYNFENLQEKSKQQKSLKRKYYKEIFLQNKDIFFILIGLILWFVISIALSTTSISKENAANVWATSALIYLAYMILIVLITNIKPYLEWRKRVKKLPLSKEELELNNINSTKAYCDFLNEYLSYPRKIPQYLIDEINENIEKYFPDTTKYIKYSDLVCEYVVGCRREDIFNSML